MPTIPLRTGDQMNEVERNGWEATTGFPVYDATYLALSGCGCRFTVQAEGEYFEWTICDLHHLDDPSLTDKEVTDYHRNPPLGPPEGTEKPAQPAQDTSGTTSWRKLVYLYNRPENVLADLLIWYRMHYALSSQNATAMMHMAVRKAGEKEASE